MTITQNLLNNIIRTNTQIAISNSTTSTPAPSWLIWTCNGLIVATLILAIITLWTFVKEDIEYYFFQKKYSKKK